MTYIQKKRVKLILLGLGVIALYIYLLGAMTAHAQTGQALVEHGLRAVAANDIDAYKDKGTDSYKENVKKDNFKKVVDALQERIKSGYKLEFLTTLRPKDKDMILELWKVSFNNEEPDLLIRIWIKDGKYSGFWWHW